MLIRPKVKILDIKNTQPRMVLNVKILNINSELQMGQQQNFLKFIL
jgi:hypothetical protein